MKAELRRLAHSFAFAGAGVVYLLRSQRNARIHLALTVLAVVLGLWLGLTSVEWAVLSLTVGLVFLAEGVNTAIEAAVDLANPDPHPLAKIAKDTAAGAVLITAIIALVVAAFLFLPRLLALAGL